MKLLHHSQGYSQYTFIQKYRISHISHSGLNRHWALTWALKERGTLEDPRLYFSQQPEWWWETERGKQGGTLGHSGEFSGMKVCPTEGKTQVCSERQQPVFVHHQPLPAAAFRLCSWKSPSSMLHLTTTAAEGTLVLWTASIIQEPFSVSHIRRQTSLALTVLRLGGVQTQPGGCTLARLVFMHTLM